MSQFSQRAPRKEGLQFCQPGFVWLFGVCFSFWKSGTRLWRAAAPNQATKQQESTQQYQQRFVHFLQTKSGEGRRCCLPASTSFVFPNRWEAKNLPFPNCSWLQALWKTPSPYLYPHLTLFYASPSTKCKKIINISTAFPLSRASDIVFCGSFQHGFGLWSVQGEMKKQGRRGQGKKKKRYTRS